MAVAAAAHCAATLHSESTCIDRRSFSVVAAACFAQARQSARVSDAKCACAICRGPGRKALCSWRVE
eukprot:6010807-Prymnesium_polylepis.1